jgi:hypothetical protein
MKSVLWLLLGLVIGGIVGWYVRGLGEPDVRASTNFTIMDTLADRQSPYLIAKGSWRGKNLASKVNMVNMVNILCDASECDLHQADVWPPVGGRRLLSMYNASFRITKLDAESVVAEPNLPDLCIRQTLTIDRIAKAVTLARTKTNWEDACSIVTDEPELLSLGEPL